MIIGLKMWPLERTQGFSNISLSDLIFDPTQPIFKLMRNFITKNILIKFHDHRTENVFDPKLPNLKLVRHSIKKSILTRFFDYWTENVASTAYTRSFQDLTK